jgi:cell division protein FtsB
MTIIQPNKNNHKINFLISILTVISVIAAVWGVFLYNQLVSLRHEVKKQETNLERAEVSNAELKNNLYSILNEKKFEPLINQQSLILDKNPEYVKTTGKKQQGLTSNN